MNVTLNWTIGSGATSQNVQYKLSSSSTWTTFITLAGSTTTATVTGLSDNLLYDLKIVSNCSGGTPINSSTMQQINMICPTVTPTLTSTTIAYSFPEIGGSVSSYVVKLFNSTGVTELASQTPTGTTTLTGTFSGLSSSTSYNIRVVPTAGSITKTDCTFVPVATSVPPSCNAPSGVTATLS